MAVAALSAGRRVPPYRTLGNPRSSILGDSTARRFPKMPLYHPETASEPVGGVRSGLGTRSPARQIRRPVVHEPTPPLEQVGAPVRGLHLVLDHVRQRGLDHLSGVVRLLCRPVPKRRPEPVRQRTQTINALRGHLAEYGVVAPQGRARIGQLAWVLEDGDCGLPEAVVELGWLLLGRIDELDEKIDGLDRKLRASAREVEETARLMTIPGIGPITALALQAFAPPMESFRRGRDFSAWLGLVPRQHTTGGKPRLGRTSKMGQRDLRRLLITGAMAVVQNAIRRGEITDPWLARMVARKPKMLVAVALANRTARMVWALTTRKEIYRLRTAA